MLRIPEESRAGLIATAIALLLASPIGRRAAWHGSAHVGATG